MLEESIPAYAPFYSHLNLCPHEGHRTYDPKFVGMGTPTPGQPFGQDKQTGGIIGPLRTLKTKGFTTNVRGNLTQALFPGPGRKMGTT